MICDVEDIRLVRSLSHAIKDPSRIEPYIYEAEHLDVAPVISHKLYKILDDHSIPTEYLKMVVKDGRIMEDKNSRTMIAERQIKLALKDGEPDYTDILDENYYDGDRGWHPGLKFSIAYFAYARMLTQNSGWMSSFGMVAKFSENSTPVNSSTLKVMENEARQIATVGLSDVVRYIDWKYCDSKDDDYDRGCESKPIRSIGLTVIGK